MFSNTHKYTHAETGRKNPVCVQWKVLESMAYPVTEHFWHPDSALEIAFPLKEIRAPWRNDWIQVWAGNVWDTLNHPVTSENKGAMEDH